MRRTMMVLVVVAVSVVVVAALGAADSRGDDAYEADITAEVNSDARGCRGVPPRGTKDTPHIYVDTRKGDDATADGTRAHPYATLRRVHECYGSRESVIFVDSGGCNAHVFEGDIDSIVARPFAIVGHSNSKQ